MGRRNSSEPDSAKRTGPTAAVKGSKAVGEPPLMLAVSVREAIKDAVAGFGGEGPVELASPSTGEAVFMAIQKRVAPKK